METFKRKRVGQTAVSDNQYSSVTLNELTNKARKICIEGEFERNYREKGTNERDISNAVDSQMNTHFEDIVLQHIMFIDTCTSV